MKTIKELMETYPEFFRDKDHAGYHCGSGWIPLIVAFCDYVKHAQRRYVRLVHRDEDNGVDYASIPDPIFNFKFDQIKEKFGTLRLYYSIWPAELDFTRFDKVSFTRLMHELDNKIDGYAAAMCHMSGQICEDTGNPGVLHSSHKGGGWLRTLSLERAKQLRYEPFKEPEQEGSTSSPVQTT